MTKLFYKHKHVAILVLVIAIAVFFRFWQFNAIPPGLYQDEAMNGADALSSLKTGEFKVFYTNNNGREGMIVWLDALAIKFFGAVPMALRLFPALAGILAVLGLYFLTKELFNLQVALASSFFMAVSFWAVNFSRMGFRAGLMPMFLIWSFYFLLHGLRLSKLLILRIDSNIFNFVIAGILFGLGFYTYISYRFASVLIVAFFILYLIKHRIKSLWSGFAIFTVVAFIIALPIGLYFLNNQGDFFGRSGQVSIFSADNPLKAVAISIVATLGMFNVAGDFNWRHNFAGSPQLFLPVGILFILGILICAKRRNLSDKFLFLWFFIFLLPNILSTEGNPHALRSLGAMPSAMIFSGIGLVWLYEKMKNYFNNKIADSSLIKYRQQLLRIKKEAFLLLIILLFFVSFAEFNKYFVKWASNVRTADAFSQNQVELANYLNSLPADTEKYVIWDASDRATDNGLPVSAQTVHFLTAEKIRINYLKSDEFDKIKFGESVTVIAPIYFNLDLLHSLNKKYSGSVVKIIGLNVGVVIVP
ncbi:MAG: glycosyltransferase family 39 protein [Candidatus Azambacteria bacterium]|nr:glycosyltransferase family 39 protein [Candidatus Azambacteria bacterium]